MAKPYFYTWTRQVGATAMAIRAAEGVELILADGRRVLDMISTNFQAAFGHSDQSIKNAVKQQLEQMPVASPKADFALKTDVSERLLEFLRLPSGRIFYTVSGSESVENALKMARQTTSRRIVLARSKSYHGATLGALSVTGDWRGLGHFSMSEWTVRIPEPDDDPNLSSTRAIIERTGPEQIAAFCLETVTGMNGVIVPDPSWWRGIQGLAEEYGFKLIVDEVSTGFGRTGGHWGFAFQEYDLRPDFVCMAKAITGGYVPFGALWVAPETCAHYDREVLVAGLTSYAHPLGLAALGAVLHHFADGAFTERKAELEACFAAQLAVLAKHKAIRRVRVKGLMACLELEPSRSFDWARGIDAGIHVATKGDAVVLAPPYVMTPGELECGLRCLREALG